MRIIAGKYRNRTLHTGKTYRPTSERVRETLFNILQNEMEGARFVDAYAGSGAIGIEALSRGAAAAYFLENHSRAVRVLEKNLKEYCPQDQWRIFSVPVMKGMQLVREMDPQVDLLFFDPPYRFSDYEELLEKAAELFPDAVYIMESSARAVWKAPTGLSVWKRREVGETCLTFLHST